MFSFKQLIQVSIMTIAVPALVACGSTNGTGASTDSSDATVDVAAAAAGSLFSSGDAQLSISRGLLARFIEQASESEEGSPNDTCQPLIDNTDEGPEGVDVAAYGVAGSYGSTAELVDLAEDDFCTLSDGTENEGDGPDGEGLFASFEIIDDVLFECTDEGVSSIVMQPGSYGVWRNTAEHQPQIYGTFNYLIDGAEEISLSCTIFLGDDEEIVYANCSSAEGEVVVEESDTSCSHSE